MGENVAASDAAYSATAWPPEAWSGHKDANIPIL